jgi:hypothetical protein
LEDCGERGVGDDGGGGEEGNGGGGGSSKVSCVAMPIRLFTPNTQPRDGMSSRGTKTTKQGKEHKARADIKAEV